MDCTTIFESSKKGCLSCSKIFINNGCDLNKFPENDPTGYCALHHSVENGHFLLVRYFLKNGANPNIKTAGGWTALHIAVLQGDYKIFDFLLKHGVNVSAQTDNKQSVLHIAAESKKRTRFAIRILNLDKELINLKNDSNETALFVAVVEGNSLNFIKILCENGAEINIQNDYGDNLLDMVEDKKIEKYLKSLL